MYADEEYVDEYDDDFDDFDDEPDRKLWDHPLVWSTVMVYSIAGLAFIWGDLVKVANWIVS